MRRGWREVGFGMWVRLPGDFLGASASSSAVRRDTANWIGRDQDEPVSGGVVQNPAVTAPRRQFGSVSVHGEEVIRFELGIICQDLLLRCPAGEPLQNLLDGDPVTANARLPESHVRIDRDPLKE